MEWQRMLKAPRPGDFTRYLLWNERKVFVGWRQPDGFWFDDDDHEVARPQPTHWMPFPKPPT